MLKALFIPTCSSPVMYWRIQSFVECAFRTGKAMFQNPLWFKDLRNAFQPWQAKMTNGPEYDPIFIRSFVPMIESGARQADVVIMQYPTEEGALELFDSIKQEFPHIPVLTEIDDNILSVPDFNQAFETYDPNSEVRSRVVRQLKASDGVIVSTPYLKEIYSDFNNNIWVIPNSIDFKRWGSVRMKSRPGIRIGWAGGSGHEGDFEPISGAIHRIAEKFDDVRFCFVNGPAGKGLPDFLLDVPNIEHHRTWVPVLRYPQMLASQGYDIGIAPVRDSAFNRGKSNLKWLENSALGIPTVAARVGHFAETVNDGVDGLLYSSEAEFEQKLTALITDRKLRSKIGLAAKERVRQDFDIVNTLDSYIDAAHEAITAKNYEEPKDDGWASIQVDLPKPKTINESLEEMQRFQMEPTSEVQVSIQEGHA
jgi:glycosyltransferase involved in cell wall biosynthesis